MHRMVRSGRGSDVMISNVYINDVMAVTSEFGELLRTVLYFQISVFQMDELNSLFH